MNESEIYAVEYTRVRKGTRGRHPIQPRIQLEPRATALIPSPCRCEETIMIDRAEVEVLRLVDLEGMYQEQAGQEMGISRGTVWRLLTSARKKMIRPLIEGKHLIVEKEHEGADFVGGKNSE